MHDFKILVRSWINKRWASKKEILRLCGKLNWACRVVRGGRTFLRRLIDLSCRLKSKHHRIWVNSESRQDILWWVSGLEYFHGNTRFISDLPPPHSDLVTDACRQSGGGYHEGDWFFPPRPFPSGWCEPRSESGRQAQHLEPRLYWSQPSDIFLKCTLTITSQLPPP